MTGLGRGCIIMGAIVGIAAPTRGQSPAYAAAPALAGDTIVVDASLAQLIESASARGLPAAPLVASGVPAPRAASMVVELLRKRASPAQVLAFGTMVESDVASGLPAEESATLRLHSFDARAAGAETNVLDAPTSTPGSLSGAARPPTPPSTKTPKRRP